MRKKKKNSILSLIIIVMMLFPQLPTRAVTNLDVDTKNENVIKEDNVDEVVETKPDNSNSNNIIDGDNDTEEKNQNTQNSSIEIQDENTNENNEDISLENKDLFGEAYEQKSSIATYSSFEPQVYEREEFNLKQESFNDVEELQPKTDANYEIALAHSDGTYTYVDSAENIEEAIDKVEEVSAGEVSNNGQALSRSNSSYSVVSLKSTNTSNSDDEAIPVILNSDGRVVSSNKSMGRILKHINGQVYGYFDKNTNVYPTSSLTGSAFTYINQGFVDDVPIIEDNGKSAKILVNGYQGWVNRDVSSSEYDMIIVPINQVTNPSYYFTENGILKHFISSNLRSNSRTGTTLEIGVAPSYLKAGVRYLSYDGNYFYDGSNITNGLDILITDLQNGNYANAVNSNNPYYNYYNYLPFRSTTTHNSGDLNRFIANYIAELNLGESKLTDSASAFIDAQNRYGVNALLALGVAINESYWGTSVIAKQKNNIFGINAVDSNPGQSADSYATVADSIYEFAKNQISRAYADPANWAYYGGYLGNKKLGANVKYASDPFWGEKASQFAFKADYFISGSNISNLKDYNNFQLGIFTSATQVKNSSGQLLYNVIDNFTQYAGYVGTSVVINSNNSGNYEINPERNTPVNTGGTSNKYHGNYSFSDKGYVNSSNIMLINTKKNGVIKKGWVKENNNWYYFNSNGEPSIGLVQIDGHNYFFNNDGTMATGWKNINGNWYYFWGGGSMAIGWVKSGNAWYYMDTNGVMVTGWKTIGNGKYYFWGGGSMATGWVQNGNNWYYFWDGGSMATGWVKSGGYWYYMKSDGVMATGWQTIGNSKYYFWGGGSMATGTIYIDGKSYYFRSDGSLA
ncbi:glucosaminidase domain-containing protein [Clostridium sp. AL.422]|uniref:glucosaminidase domain-containing protein n=1 Tax=Clostridium TaxID=1485 RepID=UPI00293DC7E5|nr:MULTISPECIES: glucosaminidase domain-containing protein [unclassified Clostridium]MDV4150377.1 glucosaminidase domain-containing protein [Clostridium sp. AL.422]